MSPQRAETPSFLPLLSAQLPASTPPVETYTHTLPVLSISGSYTFSHKLSMLAIDLFIA